MYKDCSASEIEMCVFLSKPVGLHVVFRGSIEFLMKIPTKRCSSGQCNNGSRYADRPHMENVDFDKK